MILITIIFLKMFIKIIELTFELDFASYLQKSLCHILMSNATKIFSNSCYCTPHISVRFFKQLLKPLTICIDK